ncbi:DUF6153 family protein [Streptomyces sp. NPDC050619]|uniref:DUF6153 family protein n=1 Tax=Streptomyces sp. NPDC050619 TaxID=3157214 RepID=UPI00342BFCFD
MTRLLQLAPRPQSLLRSCGLLVGALLLGLLGMHGLGPVPAAAHGPDRTVAVGMDMGPKASMPTTCEHGGDCHGHAQHADPTCASASVSGAPGVVPVLLPDVVVGAGVPLARTSPGGSGRDGGRAPPSLSELQLLRI